MTWLVSLLLQVQGGKVLFQRQFWKDTKTQTKVSRKINQIFFEIISVVLHLQSGIVKKVSFKSFVEKVAWSCNRTEKIFWCCFLSVYINSEFVQIHLMLDWVLGCRNLGYWMLKCSKLRRKTCSYRQSLDIKFMYRCSKVLWFGFKKFWIILRVNVAENWKKSLKCTAKILS